MRATMQSRSARVRSNERRNTFEFDFTEELQKVQVKGQPRASCIRAKSPVWKNVSMNPAR